jgi:hypothetical protein
MTADTNRGFDRRRVEEFLVSLGADRMPHPGGTLLEHLRRVAELLARWGAPDDIQAAGLCHACYGTSGFDHPLLHLTDRPRLAALVGPRAESLVYLYGACDRAATYPQLTGSGRVRFQDRFTGATHTPPDSDVNAFLLVTVANEVDVAVHNRDMAAEHGPALFDLFARTRERLPYVAWASARDTFAGYATVRGAR